MKFSEHPLPPECHALFSALSGVIRAQTFPPVEHELRKMRTGFRNEMEKKLNVAINAKSFPPMFDFGPGVNASIAFAHFNFRFATMRRFEMNHGRSGPFRNLDRHRH